MKKRWMARRQKEGKPFDKPNLVMGYNVQVRIALLCPGARGIAQAPDKHKQVCQPAYVCMGLHKCVRACVLAESSTCLRLQHPAAGCTGLSKQPMQVCWEKLCRYFDIEERFVHLSGDVYVTDPVKAVAACDENTIGELDLQLQLSPLQGLRC